MAFFLGLELAQASAEMTKLQRAGLVDVKPGYLVILHRENLEAMACECYGLNKAAAARMLSLLPPRPPPPPVSVWRWPKASKYSK